MRSYLFLLGLTAQLLLLFPKANALPNEAEDALRKLASNVQLYTLNNGLRLLIYQRGEAPVFAGAAAVRVGGVDEVPGATGISHMFEHMAFKGTEGIGTKDFAKEKVLLDREERLRLKEASDGKLSEADQAELAQIEKALEEVWVGSEFTQEYERRGSQDLNAQTTKELTTYYVDLPANQFEFWCQVESERLLHPVMRQFYSERDVVLEERRMRYENDPQGALYEALLEKIFPGHPYRLPVIGYANDLRRLTATALDQFRRRYYVPGNMAFALVGNLEPEATLRTFKRYFERIPAAPLPPRPDGEVKLPTDSQELVLFKDVNPVLTISYHKLPFPQPQAAALTAALDSLTSGRTSQLFKDLVLEQRVAASVDWMDAPGDLFPNVAMFWLNPMPKVDNKKLLAAFDKSLAGFLERGISQDELDRVKRRLATAYVGVLRSNHELAQDFAENEALHSDWRMSLNYYDQVMQLTADEVTAAARKYLSGVPRTIGRIERSK